MHLETFFFFCFIIDSWVRYSSSMFQPSERSDSSDKSTYVKAFIFVWTRVTSEPSVSVRVRQTSEKKEYF